MARSPWRRRLTTAAALARLLPLYLAFGALKHAVPLRVLARFAWRDPSGLEDPEVELRTMARLTKIRKMTQLADRDCLQRSLVLYRELSRAGTNPVLVVGFRADSATMLGHAWVERDGRVIADSGVEEPFVPACRFGPGGQLLPGSPTPRVN